MSGNPLKAAALIAEAANLLEAAKQHLDTSGADCTACGFHVKAAWNQATVHTMLEATIRKAANMRARLLEKELPKTDQPAQCVPPKGSHEFAR